MNFGLTNQQQDLREEVLAFSKAYFNENLVERENHQIFDRTLWEKAGQQRLQGLCIPEKYGGRGLDALTTVIALEAFGEGCEDGGLCFAIAAHLLACCVPIWKHGSEAQKTYYLPKLSNGHWVAANAMTERHSGSDAFDLKTTATYQKPNYLLDGCKTYVSNGPVADVIVTYASTNQSKGFYGGITSFLLDKEQHDFKASTSIDKMGVRTCQMGTITFDKLLISETAVLGREGGGGIIFNQSMDWERICLGAIHIGAMTRMLKATVQFVNERKSGGKAIGKNQAISQQLADLKVQLEAARLMTYQSAWAIGQKKNVSLEAASTKLFVSETYKNLATKIFQIHGGLAFRENHEAERMVRDAMGSTIYSGTSEIQKNIIIKLMGIK